MTTPTSDHTMSVVAPNSADLNSTSTGSTLNTNTDTNNTTKSDTQANTNTPTEPTVPHTTPPNSSTTSTEPQYGTDNLPTTSTTTDSNITQSVTTDNNITANQDTTTNPNATIDTATHTTDNTSTAVDTDMTESTELDPIDNPNDLLYQAPLHLAEIQKFTGKPTSEAVFQQRCSKYMKEHNMNVQQFADVCGIEVQYMKQWLPGKGMVLLFLLYCSRICRLY